MKNKASRIIVVVDDDVDLLNLLTITLENKGYIVDSFTEGNKALKFLLEQENIETISLLILDRMLPDMDGLAIAKTLKEKKGTIPPILFLSVLSSEKDILQGIKAGATDYILKPFNVEILMEKIDRLMKS